MSSNFEFGKFYFYFSLMICFMLLSKFGLDYYLYRYIIIIFIISSDGFELLVFLLSFLAVNKYFFKKKKKL